MRGHFDDEKTNLCLLPDISFNPLVDIVALFTRIVLPIAQLPRPRVPVCVKREEEKKKKERERERMDCASYANSNCSGYNS